jgi:hypothetical protein
MTTKECGGGVGSHHTPVIWWGRENQDGQYGHIIGPSWVSHLPADHSCNKKGVQNIYKFNIIICDWERRIRPRFYFLGNTRTVSLG